MKLHQALSATALSLAVFFPITAHAGWNDWFDTLTGSGDTKTAAAAVLADNDIADGLRAALNKGVKNAVQQLGDKDGFLANTQVRIPVPKHLKMIEDGLRGIGKDQIADQFVQTMNRAAERAVPEAASVFGDAISNMSIDDARGILDGGETAATEFLKRTSDDQLRGRFAPIVGAAVREAGATRSYQELLDKAGPLSNFVDTDKLDLTNYVTGKTLDGVYHMIGEEEKKIRANPAARTTDLLKKVFGN